MLSAPTQTSWACAMCAVVNQIEDIDCQMCGNARANAQTHVLNHASDRDDDYNFRDDKYDDEESGGEGEEGEARGQGMIDIGSDFEDNRDRDRVKGSTLIDEQRKDRLGAPEDRGGHGGIQSDDDVDSLLGPCGDGPPNTYRYYFARENRGSYANGGSASPGARPRSPYGSGAGGVSVSGGKSEGDAKRGNEASNKVFTFEAFEDFGAGGFFGLRGTPPGPPTPSSPVDAPDPPPSYSGMPWQRDSPEQSRSYRDQETFQDTEPPSVASRRPFRFHSLFPPEEYEAHEDQVSVGGGFDFDFEPPPQYQYQYQQRENPAPEPEPEPDPDPEPQPLMGPPLAGPPKRANPRIATGPSLPDWPPKPSEEDTKEPASPRVPSGGFGFGGLYRDPRACRQYSPPSPVLQGRLYREPMAGQEERKMRAYPSVPPLPPPAAPHMTHMSRGPANDLSTCQYCVDCVGPHDHHNAPAYWGSRAPHNNQYEEEEDRKYSPTPPARREEEEEEAQAEPEDGAMPVFEDSQGVGDNNVSALTHAALGGGSPGPPSPTPSVTPPGYYAGGHHEPLPHMFPVPYEPPQGADPYIPQPPLMDFPPMLPRPFPRQFSPTPWRSHSIPTVPLPEYARLYHPMGRSEEEEKEQSMRDHLVAQQSRDEAESKEAVEALWFVPNEREPHPRLIVRWLGTHALSPDFSALQAQFFNICDFPLPLDLRVVHALHEFVEFPAREIVYNGVFVSSRYDNGERNEEPVLMTPLVALIDTILTSSSEELVRSTSAIAYWLMSNTLSEARVCACDLARWHIKAKRCEVEGLDDEKEVRKKNCFGCHASPFSMLLAHACDPSVPCKEAANIPLLLEALIRSCRMNDAMTTVNLTLDRGTRSKNVQSLPGNPRELPPVYPIPPIPPIPHVPYAQPQIPPGVPPQIAAMLGTAAGGPFGGIGAIGHALLDGGADVHGGVMGGAALNAAYGGAGIHGGIHGGVHGGGGGGGGGIYDPDDEKGPLPMASATPREQLQDQKQDEKSDDEKGASEESDDDSSSEEKYPDGVPPDSEHALEEAKNEAEIPWVCARCTLVNHGAVPRCVACGAKQEPQYRKLTGEDAIAYVESLLAEAEERRTRIEKEKEKVRCYNLRHKKRKRKVRALPPLLRFVTGDVASCVDVSMDDYPVGALRVLFALGVRPVNFKLRDKDRAVECFIPASALFRIQPDYNLFGKASYHTYPLLCIHQEIRREVVQALGESGLLQSEPGVAVAMRPYFPMIADMVFGPNIPHLDIFDDEVRTYFGRSLLKMYFARRPEENKPAEQKGPDGEPDDDADLPRFGKYVNDDIAEYWLRRYFVNDPRLLRQVGTRRPNVLLRLTYFLHDKPALPTFDLNRVVDCLPENLEITVRSEGYNSMRYFRAMALLWKRGALEVVHKLALKCHRDMSIFIFAGELIDQGRNKEFGRWLHYIFDADPEYVETASQRKDKIKRAKEEAKALGYNEESYTVIQKLKDEEAAHEKTVFPEDPYEPEGYYQGFEKDDHADD